MASRQLYNVALTDRQVAAVLSAKTTFEEIGMSPRRVQSVIKTYSRKLAKKRLIAMKRLKASAVSRAASRHETQMRQLFLNAVKRVQSSISVSKFETALVVGEVPWHLVDPLLKRLESSLEKDS